MPETKTSEVADSEPRVASPPAEPSDKETSPERSKVVYATPPLQLARLLGEEDGGWRVEVFGAERVVGADDDVDPALLREVSARGGRVMLEVVGPDQSPLIAGVLQVRRALEIDADGDVVAELRSLRLRATKELLLTTGRAMLWVKTEDVELYGKEVLTRAREVAKILGRMITLN